MYAIVNFALLIVCASAISCIPSPPSAVSSGSTSQSTYKDSNREYLHSLQHHGERVASGGQPQSDQQSGQDQQSISQEVGSVPAVPVPVPAFPFIPGKIDGGRAIAGPPLPAPYYPYLGKGYFGAAPYYPTYPGYYPGQQQYYSGQQTSGSTPQVQAYSASASPGPYAAPVPYPAPYAAAPSPYPGPYAPTPYSAGYPGYYPGYQGYSGYQGYQGYPGYSGYPAPNSVYQPYYQASSDSQSPSSSSKQ